MERVRRILPRPDLLWRALGALAVALYLAYHAFGGNLGFQTLDVRRAQLSEAKADLAQLQADVDRVQKRVAMLDPSSPDLDFLDERVRDTLGWAKPDETVIAFDPVSERQ